MSLILDIFFCFLFLLCLSLFWFLDVYFIKAWAWSYFLGNISTSSNLCLKRRFPSFVGCFPHFNFIIQIIARTRIIFFFFSFLMILLLKRNYFSNFCFSSPTFPELIFFLLILLIFTMIIAWSRSLHTSYPLPFYLWDKRSLPLSIKAFP